VGALLLAAVLLPGEFLVQDLEQGFHRATMWAGGRASRALIVYGTLAMCLIGLLIARLVGDAPLRRIADGFGRRIEGIGAAAWAAGMGIIAFTLALLIQRLVYEGLLTNPDEMVSLIQARYLAAGMLGGPLSEDPAHWLVINSLMSEAGWVSQYPPGHLAMLAIGALVGAPLLVGPVSAGLTAAFFARAFELMLPERVRSARVASLLLAASPFTALLGGQILSHSTTMLAGSLALFASLRSRDARESRARLGWAVAAGAAGALMVAARPWTGLTVGTVLVVGPWVGRAMRGELLPRVGAVVAGGAPLGVLFLAYHQAVFGGPTTLGYTAAFGSGHGIGFHMDPWGYVYSLRSAIGTTSGDLSLLGFQIWESPLSPLLLVSLWLILRPAASTPLVRFLLVWALVSVPANFVYWFHAPRMYVESVPAWLLLAVLAVTDLAGSGEPVDESRGSRAVMLGRVRGAVAWVALLGLLAPAWFLGSRISALDWNDAAIARMVPEGLPAEPSLVFVHTNWWDRIGRVLEAEGMTSDSTEILLRLRDPCELWQYAGERRQARVTGAPPPAPIPFEAAPQNPPSPECRLHFYSDRLDVVALAPLIWQGDLPGLGPSGPMYVRDYGPVANARVLEAYPDRTPLLFGGGGEDRPPVLVPYEVGMATLWGVPEGEE
jgi:hypothetical protein